jgi:flagellar biogenesis protein FliO
MSSTAIDPIAEKFARMQQEMAAGGGLPDTAATAAASASHPLWIAAQVGLGLLVVLVLAVICIRFLKRLQGGMLRGTTGNVSDLLEVLETCHLGPQQRLIAVRMGDRVGVIGATKEGMSLVHLMDSPAEAILANRKGNPQDFSENLNRLLDRFKKPKKVSELLKESAQA